MSYPIITRKDTVEGSKIYAIPDVAQYIFSIPAASTYRVDTTLEQDVIATFDNLGVTLTFDENTPSDDTITRDKGSWVDEHFVVGMTVTIAGSVSNDGSYTIDTVTDTVITLDSGDDLADETILATDTVTVDGLYDNDIVWTEYVAATAGADKSYKQIDPAPNGVRFVRTVGSNDATVWIKS